MVKFLMRVCEPKWIVRQPDSDSLARLGGAGATSGLPSLVRRLLCLRGYVDPEAAEKFLFPRLNDLSDPFELPDMGKAVDRILEAADRGERVALYGDYDVDGVTSLTLLKTILEAFGMRPATFLPQRVGEGYGLTEEGLARCLHLHRPQLLIAVDCGTSSSAQIRQLAEAGIDTVILDHHECPPDRRPECIALVNPKAEPDSPYRYLCSAGVVFKLGHALLKRRRVSGLDLRDVLDIAAVGTVADIVPLVDENRLIVRRGLQRLETTRNAGLRALKKIAGVGSPISAADIGFRLGPRLNAAGRVDTAEVSLDLLLAESDDEARALAAELDLRNRERQTLERRTLREAELALAAAKGRCRFGIVLGSEDWHPGVVGIVASRLMRAYHRPTFVIAFADNGIGKGSGRSVLGVSLVEAINRCREWLVDGGGHDMAAGISISREKVDGFHGAFSECIEAAVNGAGGDLLTPRLHIDATADFAELTLPFLDSYELLEPFGSCNPQPLFMARGAAPAAEPQVLKDRHLKLRLMQKGVMREAMFFNAAANRLPRPPWDIAFHINRNVFRGRQSLQIVIQAIRSAKGGED